MALISISCLQRQTHIAQQLNRLFIQHPHGISLIASFPVYVFAIRNWIMEVIYTPSLVILMLIFLVRFRYARPSGKIFPGLQIADKKISGILRIFDDSY
ncbi:MAG TPA: hypothetical protein DCG53_05200 [Syntrophus sp. (in: bacteria)]|nr:hypothetical protein [Syntrophus sp. (in: bacteria)]